MARGPAPAVDAHDAAYRAGLAGRPLSGALLREAETDESIMEAWREGKADRPTDQPVPDPTAPSTSSSTSSANGSRKSGNPTAADIARKHREDTNPIAPGGPRRGIEAPRRPSSSRRPAPRRPTPRYPGTRRPVALAHDASALVLGMVAYALVLSVVQYGATGPLLWFKAKFLNQAAPAPGTTTGATSPATSAARPG